MFELEKITKDVSCKCRRMIDGNYKCTVACMLCYKGNFLDTIYIPKSIVKAGGKQLEKFMEKEVKDYDFDLTAQDIERIIGLLVEALDGKDVIDNRDKQPLNEVVRSLYKEAKDLTADFNSLLFVDKEQLYIKAENGAIQSVLEHYGFEAWRALDFKKQLKTYGLLITDKGRAYDKKIYTIGKITQRGNQGFRYLVISIKELGNIMGNPQQAKEAA